MNSINWAFIIKAKIKYLLSLKKEDCVFTSNDLVIAEFPKSGVTFLSFLISNYFRSKFNLEQKVNFFNLNDFVHDIHISNKPKTCILEKHLGYKLFKTHQERPEKAAKYIYLTRNPIFAINSYRDYFKNIYNTEISFSTLLRSEIYGLNAWLRHIKNWTSVKRPTGVAIIRYEDLISNPFQLMSQILILLGYDPDKRILTQTIKDCSRESMSKNECKTAFFGRYHLNDSLFVGRKKRNKYLISSDDMVYIKSRLIASNNAYIKNYLNEIS